MKETIFMIHGMWGNDKVWDCQKKYFQAHGYDCKTPILRFHDMAPSSLPNPELGRTSVVDYVRDLEKEITDLPSKPFIMGHSMGALLAQMLAAKGLAKAVVLLAPAPPAGITFVNATILKCFWSEITTPGFLHKPVRLTFAESVYGLFGRMPADARKSMYEKCLYESGRAIFEIGFWFLDPRGASVVDEACVQCPVLIVAGAEDKITPAKNARKLARKYKSVSTYREYADHAHWVLEEPGWEEIAGSVNDWLKNARQVAAQRRPD
jgi:non-heme chloroperoxidase